MFSFAYMPAYGRKPTPAVLGSGRGLFPWPRQYLSSGMLGEVSRGLAECQEMELGKHVLSEWT